MVNKLAQRILSANPIVALMAWRRGWIDYPGNSGCVYVLVDPRSKEIRYAGMTRRHFSYRLAEHRDDPQKSVREWVSELERMKLRPEMAVVCYAPASLLGVIELIVIRFGMHVLGWQLLNISGVKSK